MAIRLFIFILLTISVISIFVPVDNNTKESIPKDIALVTFNNSTMYTLDDIQVTRIITSSEAIRYKTRDEMYEATFIHRTNSLNKNENMDIFTANFIEKRESNLKFVDQVKFYRDKFISLETDIMYYNLDTKIAYNNHPFKGKYYNGTLDGKNLYLDIGKTYFKSEKSHFEIDLENKE